MRYDLFISYSRRDNQDDRITQLVDRIKQDFFPFAKRDLVPFFDREAIHGMQDWRQRILQGLRESRLLLACLSPAYIESEYCQWELVEYLKYEIGHLHGFNGVAPIYYVQVPGWEDRDFDRRCTAWVAELRRRQNFDLRPWHEQGEEALREAAVRERMAKLNQQIAGAILRGERAERSLGNVDAHNPHFIGRGALLRKMRDNFVTPGNIGVVTAVNGVGGLGKTALAIEYAHAFADEYGGGRWQVRCAGKDDLRLALSELATPIGFEFTEDEKKNPDFALERTRLELKKLADEREPHRCLLLLDNVDRPALLDPAMVARLNGGDWLHILATTRLGENELYGAHKDRSFLAVDELPPEEALALIESYQRDGAFPSDAEREAAQEIVRLLGCFTLAVESAAVYLGQYANDVGCVGFLARLKKEGLEGLDSAAGQSTETVLHGEKSLRATLGPALERLGAAEKLALEFAALLPPDQVALPWLRALVAQTFPQIGRDAEIGHLDPWKTLLRGLFSQRLLQATDVVDEEGQPRVVRIHQLVQQLMLGDASRPRRRWPYCLRRLEQQLDLWTWRWLLAGLIRKRNTALENNNDWINARWELEPLTALAYLWDETNHPRTSWLMNQMGQRWHTLAEWSRAEPLMRRALEIDENARGHEHPKVATDLSNLAALLQATNRLAEAEPLMRRALEIDESAYGHEHPNVATDLNNLAVLLYAANRLTEAEPLLRRVVAIFKSNDPRKQPNYAGSLNNLAALLQEMNRLDEAESLVRHALEIHEKAYGPKHPYIAIDLNNLAQLLQDTSRLDEAEPLMRRALEIDEHAYGQEHPGVAICLNNLAQLLEATNRPAEAEPLYRRALAIDERSYGPNHPYVVKRLTSLASLLQATDRLAEAEPLVRRALEIFLNITRSTGHPHPHLQVAINNYAGLLQQMGRSEEQISATLREMAPEMFG
jgi:tetratricopeptide (TPR) repeat protein